MECCVCKTRFGHDSEGLGFLVDNVDFNSPKNEILGMAWTDKFEYDVHMCDRCAEYLAKMLPKMVENK